MKGQHALMLGRPLRSVTLLLSFAAFLPIQAQTENSQDSCDVIIPKEYYKFQSLSQSQSQRAKARRVPSHFTTPSTESVIKNTGKVYAFRLAACILPEYINNINGGFGNYNSPLKNDEIIEEVEAWWNELEEGLNALYTNDVGIKFKVVRDKRLILFNRDVNGLTLSQDATNETRLYLSKKIIDKALGDDAVNYDLGILIGQPNQSRNGVAQLGSAASATLKGSAWAVSNITTIAHEIGHSFGAEHTHIKDDAICTEPGSGRSIMSYGSPRDFFSLPSIYQMRNTLANMNYYSDEERKTLVKIYEGNETNTPYAVEEEKGADPKLNRQLIKTEYTVTTGTNFQFYLPTSTENDGAYYYNVNSFDFSKGDTQHENTLRPAYKETKESVVMFQPHCIAPSALSDEQKRDGTLHYEQYTDASRTGTYTFVAAVHDYSRYDAMRIKLNIVDGQPFQITNVISPSRSLESYGIGRTYKIYWDTCADLYGKNSKVRVLLSDDFGKTYKYVLADNQPNNGYCEFVMPYINIGKVNYEGWANFMTGGGRLKIEVIGEAAFDIYPKQDYTYQNEVVTKGWELQTATQRVQFKTTDGSELPKPYLTVKSLSEVPPMATNLVAYSKNTPDKTLECQQSAINEGNLIRRSWSSNVNGINYTYTQLIKLPETVTTKELVSYQAQQLATMAKVLYDNIDNIGYPKSNLAEATEFKNAYDKVYNNGDIITTNANNIDNLREAMTKLTKISDDKVTMPENGKYYQVRSYLSPYNRDTYYYMVDTGEGEKLVNEADFKTYTSEEQKQSSLWLCTVKNGKYQFTSVKGHPLFDPYVADGGSLDNSLSDFRNFSNSNTDRTLERGYTWGSFTILNNDHFGSMVSLNGQFSVVRGVSNGPMKVDQRCNCNDGMIVSTDFQFVPVNTVPTSISLLKEDGIKSPRKKGIYTIDGRKVDDDRNLRKGLYIIDGKKVVR